MSPSSAGSKPSSASSDLTDLGVPAGDGLVARLERAVAPYAHRFAEAPAVLALRESLPVALAAVAVSIVVMLVVQPFAGWAALAKELREAIGPAFSIASFVMVVVLALRLARRLGYAPVPMLGFALLTFWLMLPRHALHALAMFVATRGASGWGAFASTLGASGLFTAIVVCLATAGAIALARRRYGPVLGTIAGGVGLVLIAWGLFALNFSLAGAIAVIVAPLATLGDSFTALIVLTAVEAVLWIFGIHGPALLAALVVPVYLHLQLQNTDAFAHHHPLPHIVVVSTFLFVFPGGAGATLPLILLLLRSRVPRLRAFAYATILPSLINVNEPVIFGLPLAYNPVLAVPFVLAPVVLACTTYAAMALGFVARPAFYIPATIPAFLNAFLATLDWRACALIALNLVVAGAIWFPFVRVYERTVVARAATTARAASAASG
ncbi:MAG TPA: PTS transporter subunit EIIC [Candidatus Elarobacter sp.]|jgi:PTS system cellobiose-specific IIC component|nr:PTS transporter subunit EIIC [Candidatus Elarobacter sp.]